jgi:hypothetical protein
MSTTPTHSIPVPEPELTAQEMVQRARDLVPTLWARQAEAEELGRLPDETSRDFVEAGFYRILQPRALRRLRVRPAHVHARGDRAGARLSGQRLDLHPDRPRPHARGAVAGGGADRHLRRRRRGAHAWALPSGHGPGGRRRHRRRRLRRVRDHRQLGCPRTAGHGVQARRRRRRLRPGAQDDRLHLPPRRAACAGPDRARGPDLPRGHDRRSDLLRDRLGGDRRRLGRARPLRGERASARPRCCR